MITLADVVLAQNRIRAFVSPTPLEPAPGLGENVYLKLENANLTHSFKIRGALNAVLSMDPLERDKGILAASTGNHAQAVAYAAARVGATARIYMPAHTPRRKVDGVIRHGGTPLLEAANYDEAEAMARRLEKQEGRSYISAYNDTRVVAGAGTIGLEIVQNLPDLEMILVPVSGGGLLAGVAALVRALRPRARIIGVCADRAAAMYNEFYGTDLPANDPTLAEALSGVVEAGCFTIELCKKLVDEIVLVDEEQIAAAMRWMIDERGWIVEGGGAVGVAALLGGVVRTNGAQTAVVISGGNVDGATIRKILS